MPLHLHDFPLPLAYGAAPFAVAAAAVVAGLAARRSGRVLRGMLVGLGIEALLIFAGPVYTLFISNDEGSPGTGLYVGLAAGAVLLASALAAVVTRRPNPAVR